MVDNLKERLRKVRKAWGQLTPEQKKWSAVTLALAGIGIIAKAFWEIQPSITTGTMEAVIFISAIICYAKLTTTAPGLHKSLKWVMLLFVGGALNFAVVLANGGFMTTAYSIVTPQYIPMVGSRLPYLGDWLWLGASPGDVLVIVALVGSIVTLVRKQEHKLVEQA